ncbi:aspartate/glutamate racemase family protein [Chloroflexota bacterium]
MRILVINPNSSMDMTRGIDDSAREYASASTEIQTVSSTGGPLAIECLADAESVKGQITGYVHQANEENYDAVIMACYGQSLQKAAKEISKIPVYGIAEPQLYMACLLGSQFSVIGLKKNSDTVMRERLESLGLISRCASVRTIGVSIMECVVNRKSTYTALMREARLAVAEDGAEVICLGCAGLAGLDKPMQKELGVSVLDGVVCAVKMCEAVFEYRL